MDRAKLQNLKNNGYFEVTKEEIIEEFSKHKGMPKSIIEEAINKFRYYRVMSDGKKMFYSEEYLDNHTIEELEENFKKIS